MLNICKRISIVVGSLIENQMNELSKTITEIKSVKRCLQFMGSVKNYFPLQTKETGLLGTTESGNVYLQCGNFTIFENLHGMAREMH